LVPTYFGLPRIFELTFGLDLILTTHVERYKTKLFGIGRFWMICKSSSWGRFVWERWNWGGLVSVLLVLLIFFNLQASVRCPNAQWQLHWLDKLLQRSLCSRFSWRDSLSMIFFEASFLYPLLAIWPKGLSSLMHVSNSSTRRTWPIFLAMMRR
jgi:hypothetical protein